MFNIYLFRSLEIALNGLKFAFTRHPNFRIHLIFSVLAIFLSLIFQISRMEFIIIILTILLGFTVEFINTAIEQVCDLVTHEWRKEIKFAKDLSAAMMLVVAIGSAVIGLIIFLPYYYK